MLPRIPQLESSLHFTYLVFRVTSSLGCRVCTIRYDPRISDGLCDIWFASQSAGHWLETRMRTSSVSGVLLRTEPWVWLSGYAEAEVKLLPSNASQIHAPNKWFLIHPLHGASVWLNSYRVKFLWNGNNVVQLAVMYEVNIKWWLSFEKVNTSSSTATATDHSNTLAFRV